MFREIRTAERITEEDERKNREYLKIRPETDITVEECTTFWNYLFQRNEASFRASILFSQKIHIL